MSQPLPHQLPESTVLTGLRGRAGVIELHRPRAINALTHDMVQRVAAQLDAWADDSAVAHVVITGAGERGLCAGGDIVAIYHDAVAGGDATRSFWWDEYRLNAAIADYPKPIVAVMHGLVMGGGVGISAHASLRVVTETTRVAMPEVGIGFIPDVGGTFLLTRRDGHLGTYAALTGVPCGADDAIAMGLADHAVPQADLPALLAALAREDAAVAVRDHERVVGRSPLARTEWVDEVFALPTVGGMIDALRDSHDERARKTAEVMVSRSPLAISVTAEALRRARDMDDLRDVLVQEYRTSLTALRSEDMVEGIRAQVIDKDRAPRWSHDTLGSVTAAEVDSYFAPINDGRELSFEAGARP